MNLWTLFISLLVSYMGYGQVFDTSRFTIHVEYSQESNTYFTHDLFWRGADGAASIDLEHGKVLWLFSDSFICKDSSGSRKKSTMINNSIAIQDGYDIKTASIKYYWNKSYKKPQAFFKIPGKSWFWTGHGVMIRDKLIVFLMKEHRTKTGLGFEAIGWYAAIISNPTEEPTQWNIQYIKGPETYGTIAGSAAVLKDENYLYAYGAVEPATHEVYLLRWKLDDAYVGYFAHPQWWINEKWMERKMMNPIPKPLFIGGTEYSVHYDKALKKFIQIQSFGFGEGTLGIRLSDSLQGRWTEPQMFYTPSYPGVKRPFMYAAKAHPELQCDGMLTITYNVNSFDLSELTENETIYFPKFISIKIKKSDDH